MKKIILMMFCLTIFANIYAVDAARCNDLLITFGSNVKAEKIDMSGNADWISQTGTNVYLLDRHAIPYPDWNFESLKSISVTLKLKDSNGKNESVVKIEASRACKEMSSVTPIGIKRDNNFIIMSSLNCCLDGRTWDADDNNYHFKTQLGNLGQGLPGTVTITSNVTANK